MRVVGAPYTNRAYVFARHGSTWTQSDTLFPVSSSQKGFGASIALVGNTVVVADESAPAGGGYDACVYVQNGSGLATQAVLTIPDTVPTRQSHLVETLVALSCVHGSDSAYVFVRTGDSWTQQAHLTPNQG